jgi:hypothetical protein
MNKLDIITVKYFCFTKEFMKRMNTCGTHVEKTFIKHVSDEEAIPKMYKGT